MKFEDSGLPGHPEVEKAFAAVNTFYGNDKATHFIQSVAEAKFLADNLNDRNPAIIGAALLLPAIQLYGATFDRELEGTTVLNTVQACEDLCKTPEDEERAYTKDTAALMLASLASVAETIRKRDSEMNEHTDSPLYDAYKRAFQRDREELLKPQIYRIIAEARKPIAAMGDGEDRFVKAFNDRLDATERQLASPFPPKAAKGAPKTSLG